MFFAQYSIFSLFSICFPLIGTQSLSTVLPSEEIPNSRKGSSSSSVVSLSWKTNIGNYGKHLLDKNVALTGLISIRRLTQTGYPWPTLVRRLRRPRERERFGVLKQEHVVFGRELQNVELIQELVNTLKTERKTVFTKKCRVRILHLRVFF